MTTFTILERKPRPAGIGQRSDMEYAVCRREDRYHPFVVCTITPETLANNEWFWGSYHETLSSAVADFNKR